MSTRWPIAVLVLLAPACFVESIFWDERDCPAGERFLVEEGTCFAPCAGDEDCPAPQVCNEQDRCVLECVEDPDCLLGEVCEHHRCLPAHNRLPVPAFEGVDDNPSSSTHGQTVSLAGLRGRVLVLYFASAQ